VAWALAKRGIALSGVDMAIQGDIPIGSGLSSSAALEVCVATAFQVVSGFELGKVELALACQKAENGFVGVQCGIMDQFISALGREGHALLIDCRDLSTRDVSLPEGAAIVVCDTMKRRGLVDSEYNTRRAECAEAVRLLAGKLNRPLRALRDVSLAELEEFQDALPPNVAKRARHIVGENARVLEAASAAEKGDLVTLGKLMDASHVSMRDDYQISCAELDTMVEIAKEQTGCLGARLTGAGFGGCTVNLVAQRAVQDFLPAVARQYRKRVGVDPQIYACRAAAGASVIQ
jgi:galactokinase